MLCNHNRVVKYFTMELLLVTSPNSLQCMFLMMWSHMQKLFQEIKVYLFYNSVAKMIITDLSEKPFCALFCKFKARPKQIFINWTF